MPRGGRGDQSSDSVTFLDNVSPLSPSTLPKRAEKQATIGAGVSKLKSQGQLPETRRKEYGLFSK